MTRQLPMTRPCLRLTASLLLAAMLGAPALHGQTPVPPGLQRAEPMACDGHDDLIVRGRFIETAGNGIVVSGDCDVEVVGSYIVAGGVGILVNGDGDAIVRDSHVEGRRAALLASGDGEIRYYGTTLRGGVRTEGHGEIAGDDGTVRGGKGSAAAADLGGLLGGTSVKIDAGGVAVREGSETISIRPDGVGIRGGGDTVSVTPTPNGVAVDTGDASVVVDGDAVRLRTDDTLTEVTTRWRLAGTSVYRASDTDRLLVELGATEEDGALRLGLAGDVLFGFDSAAIRPQATAMLAKVAHVLRQRAGGEIRVVGHTDSIGNAEYNRKLSEARAVAVMRWLHAEEGIPAQLMVGRGLGSEKPVAYNTLPDGSDNPEGRARNRRVEIFFATSR